MKLDVRSALVLRHPDQKQVLLLRRSPTKRLFPNLITGIGGGVELELGEGDDLIAATMREFTEETVIPQDLLRSVRLRLSTIISRGELQVILLWLTGQLADVPLDLSCNEGQLEFHTINKLPIEAMIPTARQTIPFVLGLHEDDRNVYNGCFTPDMQLLTNG